MEQLTKKEKLEFLDFAINKYQQAIKMKVKENEYTGAICINFFRWSNGFDVEDVFSELHTEINKAKIQNKKLGNNPIFAFPYYDWKSRIKLLEKVKQQILEQNV